MAPFAMKLVCIVGKAPIFSESVNEGTMSKIQAIPLIIDMMTGKKGIQFQSQTVNHFSTKSSKVRTYLGW